MTMDLDSHILSFLVSAGKSYVSGAEIARAAGVTRVSVHNRMESMKAEGFAFEAVRNRGYRLLAEPEVLHPGLLRALFALEPCPTLKHLDVIGSTHSTNDVASERLAQNMDAPLMVIADEQTRGRGRRGRSWHSPPGKNLYLSIGTRPRMPPVRLQTLTLAMGIAACRFLRDRFELPILLKWPNDLMLHGKKLAGMLTEARVDAELTRDLVFGLGLNVNLRTADFPHDLHDIGTSLAEHLDRTLSLSRLAHPLASCLVDRMEQFVATGPDEGLASEWTAFDYLKGQRVITNAVEGVAQGINTTGALRIRRDDGSTAFLHSGEVSLKRPLDGCPHP